MESLNTSANLSIKDVNDKALLFYNVDIKNFELDNQEVYVDLVDKLVYKLVCLFEINFIYIQNFDQIVYDPLMFQKQKQDLLFSIGSISLPESLKSTSDLISKLHSIDNEAMLESLELDISKSKDNYIPILVNHSMTKSQKLIASVIKNIKTGFINFYRVLDASINNNPDICSIVSESYTYITQVSQYIVAWYYDTCIQTLLINGLPIVLDTNTTNKLLLALFILHHIFNDLFNIINKDLDLRSPLEQLYLDLNILNNMPGRQNQINEITAQNIANLSEKINRAKESHSVLFDTKIYLIMICLLSFSLTFIYSKLQSKKASVN